MVQAAASGAIDFANADLLDRQWWLKLRWILDRLEDEHMVDVYRLQHAQHASVLDYELDKQVFETHWEGGNKLIKKVYGTHFPWNSEQVHEDQKKKIYDELVEKWRARFGDLRDPAVKEKYDRMAKAMHDYNIQRRTRVETTTNPTRDSLRKILAHRRKIRK